MSDYIFPVLGDSRISSRIGARSSPGGIGSTNHAGLDIAAPRGTGVVSPVAGTVIFSGPRGGFGNFVEIAGSDGLTHRFAHLNTRNVIQGQSVQAGGAIGTVGSTGNSTGNHLHYEIRDAANKIINPEKLLEKGKKLLGESLNNAIRAAANSNPVTGAALGVTDAIGLTGECNLLCQFQNWIKDSGFFTRLALAILAFVILAVAIGLLGKGGIQSQVKETLKGAM